MISNVRHGLCAGVVFACGATAQSGGPQAGLQYGENQVVVSKDSDVVAAAFPDVNITLLSPAFMNPETVPATFANGTDGPTDDTDLGKTVLVAFRG
jgi:hypothetical protein